MIKRVCDRCGKEICIVGSSLTNARFPMYSITVQDAPCNLPRSVDLCGACLFAVSDGLTDLIYGGIKEGE